MLDRIQSSESESDFEMLTMSWLGTMTETAMSVAFNAARIFGFAS